MVMPQPRAVLPVWSIPCIIMSDTGVRAQALDPLLLRKLADMMTLAQLATRDIEQDLVTCTMCECEHPRRAW